MCDFLPVIVPHNLFCINPKLAVKSTISEDNLSIHSIVLFTLKFISYLMLLSRILNSPLTMLLMMLNSDFISSFFSDEFFFTVPLKDFSSSFVPHVADVAWPSFIFREREWGPIFGVDFHLTECFEFPIAMYLNY